MSETLLIWLFGILGGWMVVLSTAVFNLLLKLARLETMLSMKSRTASKILHSPDDHLNLDDLLEKHHNGTITITEWLELKPRLEQITGDTSYTAMERSLANEILGDPKNGVRKT